MCNENINIYDINMYYYIGGKCLKYINDKNQEKIII